MKSKDDNTNAFIFWGAICLLIMLISLIVPKDSSSSGTYSSPQDDTYIYAYQKARKEGYSKEESDIVERAVRKYVEQQKTRQ